MEEDIEKTREQLEGIIREKDGLSIIETGKSIRVSSEDKGGEHIATLHIRSEGIAAAFCTMAEQDGEMGVVPFENVEELEDALPALLEGEYTRKSDFFKIVDENVEKIKSMF